MDEKNFQRYLRIAEQKMAFAGHVMKGSNGQEVLKILQGKIRGTKGKGRPRR
jgi:hypothetical protein